MLDGHQLDSSKPRRGIYLLPNLLTTGAMFAGFYAIVAAIALQFSDAVIAVFVAGLLDGLDGRIARLTNTQSEFGVQYDSLSDLVSFGVAPALVLYVWSLRVLKAYGPAWGKLGWAAAFTLPPAARCAWRDSIPRPAAPTSAISRGWRFRPPRAWPCRIVWAVLTWG